MKIIIIGASGQLAYDLIKTFHKHELILLYHQDIDVTNREYLCGFVKAIRPDIIINTAAFHQVDACEEERIRAFDVNCLGAMNGAIAAESVGAVYVWYSSDYVFGADESRNTPYTENDPPAPINIYGHSKVAGEIAVRNICRKHFVIRSSGLYGKRVSGKGHNFPNLMLKLARERDEVRVVNDQRLTPTFTKDLAEKTVELVASEKYGLYHLTNSGDCTWYEFTKKIFEIAGITTQLTPVTSEAFPTKAVRPKYSVLDNLALRSAGFLDMRPWQEAIREYLSI